MAKQRIDVMISSTSKDLPDHRKEVQDAILRLRMFPLAMEHLGAMPDADAISASLEMVDQSEVYVGVFGFRYGYIPDDSRNPDKISITEMEYRRAIERDIPVLIFLMDDEHDIKPKDIEKEPDGVAKLAKLKDELGKKHIVGFFKSPEALRSLVLQALVRVKDAAAERAGENDPVEEDPTSAITRPPELYSVPPYVLTNNFIGRETELRQLDTWAASADPMLIVEAIGGMGKSALTWEWVQRQKDSGRYDGIFWYSFYERGAQMNDFMRHALAYVTEQPADDLKGQNFYELQDALLPALQQKNYLLVLDGLERVLVAYHRMDKAQVRDDEVQEKLRDTTNPKDGRFLQKLLSCAPSRFLVSTRLMPRALQDFNGDPIKGVKRKKLAGLHPDDAYVLMRDRGVKEPQDRQQMNDFMAQFGYHGLLLTITAGRISRYRPARGDFDAWYALHGQELNDPDIVQRRNKLLRYAYDGLDDKKRLLLSQIAAFGNPVDYETVALFNPYLKKQPPTKIAEPPSQFDLFFGGASLQHPFEDRDEQQEAYEAYVKELEVYKKTPEYIQALSKFDEALSELEDRGLLMWERKTDSYDLHPVVRGYSFAQLDTPRKTETYDVIYVYFDGRPVAYEQAQTVDDLHNAIMVYQALVGAGRLEQAANFYRGTFARTMLYNLTAYPTIVELLKPLFPDGFDRLPSFADKRLQGYVINDLALIFARSGQLAEALVLDGLNIRLEVERKDSTNLGVNLRNHADNLRWNNQLSLAERGFLLALRLAQATDNEQKAYDSHFYLLQLISIQGHWDNTEIHWQALQPDLDSVNGGIDRLIYAKTQFFQGNDPNKILQIAHEKLLESRHTFKLPEYHELCSWVALRQGDLSEAVEQIEQAITYAQRSGDAELASYQATLGLARARQGNLARAQALLATAIDTNAFPFNFAHIYNCAAEVWQQAGDDDQATDFALKAYKYAWADGEPHYQWYQLQIATGHLATLGVPHPALPPYDDSQREKLPHEDEVIAYIEELERKKAEREAREAAKNQDEEDFFGASDEDS